MTAEMTRVDPSLLPPSRELNIATIDTTESVQRINTKAKPFLPKRLQGSVLNSHTKQTVIIYSCKCRRNPFHTFHRSLRW